MPRLGLAGKLERAPQRPSQVRLRTRTRTSVSVISDQATRSRGHGRAYQQLNVQAHAPPLGSLRSATTQSRSPGGRLILFFLFPFVFQ
jgi:hypothetical protein